MMNSDAPGIQGPATERRGVYLRPIVSSDMERLRVAEFVALGTTWRSRGSTPSPDAFAKQIWQGSLTQVLAFQRKAGSDELVGWFQLYDVEHDNGVGSFGAAHFGGDPPAFGIAMVLFLDHVFHSWSLRKLYLEVPSYNESVIERWVPALATIEGRLLERVFYGGEFVDVGIYSLSREAWTRVGRREVLQDS